MNKLSTEEFILKAKEKHGNKFDYSLVDYKNSTTKIKIICPIHGVFIQKPREHMTGCGGCKKCSGKKMDTNIFIMKAKEKHGDKFDYSLVDYKNTAIKIKIICPIHGIFIQKPSNHLNGSNCPFCNGMYKTNESVINEFNNIHKNIYDYSLVDYKNSTTKIKIICPIHGIFEQTPPVHLKGSKCPSCSRKCTISKKTIPMETFLKRAIIKHGDRFDYSLVEYINTNTPIKIICRKHGIFEQKPNNHLRSDSGCNKCKSSKGEVKITEYLEKNNIIFISQKRFKDCKYKSQLPFDFYLPDYNTVIEFDGEQHYKPKSFGSDKSRETTQSNYVEIIKRDKIKTDYCLNNNIRLIRIPYWNKDKINDILRLELT